MITVICATHRPQNQTLSVVKKYAQILEELGEEVNILKMDELPGKFLSSNTMGEQLHSLDEIVREKIEAAERFVIIAPEYNGSYPGVFKAFLDNVPPHKWRGKKVALVGVATGRAGNLRGMDHLTDVMHYLRAEVFSLKIPISQLANLMEAGEISDIETISVLKEQARQFLLF